MANMREDEAVRVDSRFSRVVKILDGFGSLQRGDGDHRRRFEEGDYFLPELILAGEMLKTISTMAQEKLGKGVKIDRSGKVLIGTVKGDIHDIGKDIVVFMLDSAGFEVLDLGIDVPHEKFVDAIRNSSPRS